MKCGDRCERARHAITAALQKGGVDEGQNVCLSTIFDQYTSVLKLCDVLLLRLCLDKHDIKRDSSGVIAADWWCEGSAKYNCLLAVCSSREGRFASWRCRKKPPTATLLVTLNHKQPRNDPGRSASTLQRRKVSAWSHGQAKARLTLPEDSLENHSSRTFVRSQNARHRMGRELNHNA